MKFNYQDRRQLEKPVGSRAAVDITKDMWLSGGKGIVLICAFAIGKFRF